MIAQQVFIGLFLSAASLSSTLALSRTYDVGTGSSVTANTSVNDGLAIRTELASGLSSQLFTLNDGQSHTFNFFKIWTDETAVDADDWVPRTITARLDFESPDVTAQVQGITFSATLLGHSGGGVLWNDALVWNDSVTVSLADRVFKVTLNDAYFDLAQGGLGNSPAIITATVKQISSGGITAVPDAGSTVALLGAALGAMAMLRRKTA